MMPLGAPSISKYGSLVWPDAQIVALRAHCTRTALKAPPKRAKSDTETMASDLRVPWHNLAHWFFFWFRRR